MPLHPIIGAIIASVVLGIPHDRVVPNLIIMMPRQTVSGIPDMAAISARRPHADHIRGFSRQCNTIAPWHNRRGPQFNKN